MKLSTEQLVGANLAWVHDVFVRVGEVKDPGTTVFYKLIVRPTNPAIKPSRANETVLHIVVDHADESVLASIKEALLNNASLAEAHDSIRSANWYRSIMEIELT